jgi:hypothetical protein
LTTHTLPDESGARLFGSTTLTSRINAPPPVNSLTVLLALLATHIFPELSTVIPIGDVPVANVATVELVYCGIFRVPD